MALFNFWKSKEWRADNVKPAEDITQTTALEYGMSSAPISSLLGDANRPPRDRVQIYQKWEAMEGDPIVSSAVKLLVTGALGGHETSGDVVFIDDRPDLKEGEKNIVQEIREHCGPIINKVVYQMAYLGAIFGDSYSRIYVDGNGLVDLDCSEMVRPPLVQAYEQGSRTIGYSISVGKSLYERLTAEQMARLKMPRTQYVPQNTALHKAMRLKLSEDDINALPVMPALVGGSLLYPAEQPYWNLAAALLGIVGQRWIDSIDEQIIMPNMDSMTAEHQKRFMDGIKDMFQSSKANAEKAVKSGLPILERMRYLMPVFGDKQMITVAPLNGGNPGRAGQITIDDVMLHARMLAGALGVDLSMLGFADQMSGGLGEGGFFRTSAQAAEQARAIRQALTDWINHVLDVHCLHKYGVVYQNKLWDINFYGSISALEAEKQRTMVDKANYGGLLMQSMQMMKDMGADQQLMSVFLEKTMGLDEDVAKEFARIVDLKKVDDQEQEQGGKMVSFLDNQIQLSVGSRVQGRIQSRIADKMNEAVLSRSAQRLLVAARSQAGAAVNEVMRNRPSELVGNITLKEAEMIHAISSSIERARKNYWMLEIESPITTDRVAAHFNMLATDVDYTIANISGDRKRIGGATIDSLVGREPIELRVTCLDDASGMIKNWFLMHVEQASPTDGTINVPASFAIKIRVVHNAVTEQSRRNEFETYEYFRPISIETSLSRRDSALSEVTMTFSQMDSFVRP